MEDWSILETKNIKLAFAVLTDGRAERIERSFPTWTKNLDLHRFNIKIIFDSSGDDKYAEYLSRYDMDIVKLGKQDLANAFNRMFKYLSQLDFDYLLLFEDDFSVPEYINISDLLYVLEYAELDQLTLVRQPYYPFEIEAGSLMNLIKSRIPIIERTYNGYTWIEHNAFWTNNPSLITKRVFDVEYPIEFHQCEINFFSRLKQIYPEIKTAYYGAIGDTPRVIHYPLKF